MSPLQRLEAAFGRTRSQRCPGSHRPSDTPEVFCPEVLKLEQIAQQFSCALGYDYRVRFSHRLKARSKVRGFTDNPEFLRLSRSDQVANDNEPGRNADPGL